jgi:hypothetical protein
VVRKENRNVKKDFTSLILVNNSTSVLSQIGQIISSPSSSREYRLMESSIFNALDSSSAQTFNFIPPMALLTNGSVSTVNWSKRNTSIPSASSLDFMICASEEY